MTIRATVIGGAGYTGVELVRLLCGHPDARLVEVVSRSNAGRGLAEVFPHFAGATDLVCSAEASADADVVFFATPHGVAMEQAPAFLDAGMRVIDLSPDFRFKDAALWTRWYGCEHAAPNLLGEAVYGLPELFRADIAKARLVANPGCYPTSVVLGYAPLLRGGLIDAGLLIADSKSGVSGAGRQGGVDLLMAEVAGSIKAYKASGHRHQPEMHTQLERLAGGPVALEFTPHLVPMVRGIFSTLYFKSAASPDELQTALADAWRDEPFVRLLPPGAHPQTRETRGTNVCRIALHHADVSAGGGIYKLLVVLDNLVKGASGQAVQNMNVMFGLDETRGLEQLAVLP